MNLFVKTEDNQIVGHPYLEDNLKHFFQVDQLTDALLDEHNFKRVVRASVPVSSEVVGEPSFELRDDGLAYEVIPTRELTQDERLNLWVRRPRDWYLAVSDWTDLPNCPLSTEKKAEWQTYRQALRDLTKNLTALNSPDEVVFPTRPA